MAPNTFEFLPDLFRLLLNDTRLISVKIVTGSFTCTLLSRRTRTRLVAHERSSLLKPETIWVAAVERDELRVQTRSSSAIQCL